MKFDPVWWLLALICLVIWVAIWVMHRRQEIHDQREAFKRALREEKIKGKKS